MNSFKANPSKNNPSAKLVKSKTNNNSENIKLDATAFKPNKKKVKDIISIGHEPENQKKNKKDSIESSHTKKSLFKEYIESNSDNLEKLSRLLILYYDRIEYR